MPPLFYEAPRHEDECDGKLLLLLLLLLLLVLMRR